MKKILTTILALGFLLAACGQNQDNNNDQQNSNSDNQKSQDKTTKDVTNSAKKKDKPESNSKSGNKERVEGKKANSQN